MAASPDRSAAASRPRPGGQHRARRLPDLMIAAAADLAGLTVLHIDKDFDVIATVAGQPVERLNLE